jgi:hypothetical protein
MQPVTYSLSKDEEPSSFLSSTFRIGIRNNLHILANNTLQRPAPLAAASLGTESESARCFQHNFLDLMLSKEEIARLKLFLEYELFKNTSPRIEYSEERWNPCIMCAAPAPLNQCLLP